MSRTEADNRENRDEVLLYIQEHGSITNSKCRDLLGIDYDSAILLFNRMLNDGQLVRVGKTSGIKYILPDNSDAN